jgi:KDO2-lipid IV(A) lauroyltransferase
VKHRLEYALVMCVRAVVAWLPWSAARALGSSLGRIAYVFDRKHRNIALGNLEAAFPTRTPRERRAIARGVFAHFGFALLDLLKFSTVAPDRMASLVEFEGEERVRHAYAQGKGVLFFTGHFGCWEVIPVAHAARFEPMEVLVRPLDNPDLNALIERVRCSTGSTLIYKRGAIRRMLRTISDGHGVGLLIDQHLHGPDAVVVDFFGRPAATTSALAAIALRTGAPVLPMFALPAKGRGYRLICEHPVEPPAADAADRVRDFTQRCTDVLEMYVRRHPHLWLWVHRRWKIEHAMLENAPSLVSTSQDLEADA